MDVAAIVRAIDAEIEKLNKVREIISSLAKPSFRKKPAAKKDQIGLSFGPAAAVSQPEVVVLPPVKKREYRRRTRAGAATAPAALAAAPTDKPVFVPRSQVVVTTKPRTTAAPPPAPATPDEMEAAMRQKLLGGVA